MKKKIIVALVLSLSVLALSACGAKQSASAKKDIIVGTNAEFPPFEYIDDSGNPDGFDIALVKAIGEKLGKNVTIQNMEFDSLISSIGTKTDLVIAGMTVTDERKQSVDFTEPYYTAVQSVIVPVGSAIASFDDLKGKKIGVQMGTTADFISSDIEGAETARYNKSIDAVNDLLNGRLDCVIVDKNPAETFVASHTGELEALEGSNFDFEDESYAMAVAKGDAEFLKQVNDALSELKADGTIDKLTEEYIGD
ncbi:MAG: basic amino acid ABC transporter substrate-binding protein [Lachnospiraceae bacterium]|nr:basic amino acid ABC transporter substrate-binding protein [Lachnospiraceae bacterium]